LTENVLNKNIFLACKPSQDKFYKKKLKAESAAKMPAATRLGRLFTI
jgi:hypothetical protein